MTIDKQLDELKSLKQDLLVDFNIFRSNRIRFSENGIKTIETDLSKEGNLLDVAFSYTKLKAVENNEILEEVNQYPVEETFTETLLKEDNNVFPINISK